MRSKRVGQHHQCLRRLPRGLVSTAVPLSTARSTEAASILRGINGGGVGWGCVAGRWNVIISEGIGHHRIQNLAHRIRGGWDVFRGVDPSIYRFWSPNRCHTLAA